MGPVLSRESRSATATGQIACVSGTEGLRQIEYPGPMAESMRQRFEREEDERLSPYALRSRGVSRRYAVENARR